MYMYMSWLSLKIICFMRGGNVWSGDFQNVGQLKIWKHVTQLINTKETKSLLII